MKSLYQGRGWYIAIILVLLSGYAVGIILPIGVYFHDWFKTFIPDQYKIYCVSFLIGLLGVTVQNSIYFAMDFNASILKHDHPLPTVFDSFGYILKYLWGGVAAVILILAIKTGFFAVFTESTKEMRPEAVVVLSFVAGLRALGILKKLAGLADKITAG